MFELGKIYNRREDLHDRFGGSYQRGIAPCANHPYVFLFSSPKGEDYGYNDGWISDKEFRYTGEGQKGDMRMVRGNKAIYKHQEQGRELHLFEKVATNQYVYRGQLEYLDHVKKDGIDIDGQPRKIIQFRLRKIK